MQNPINKGKIKWLVKGERSLTMDSKFNKFKNKKEFVEEFKRRIIERYGRSIEEAHITEKYIVLGEMVRDYASVNWMDTSKSSKSNMKKKCIIFQWNF